MKPDNAAYVPWWPGRTNEVRRVADRLRKLDQPDGHTTRGELARRCGCDVWIVSDAIALNDEIADAAASWASSPFGGVEIGYDRA